MTIQQRKLNFIYAKNSLESKVLINKELEIQRPGALLSYFIDLFKKIGYIQNILDRGSTIEEEITKINNKISDLLGRDIKSFIVNDDIEVQLKLVAREYRVLKSRELELRVLLNFFNEQSVGAKIIGYE